MRACVHACLQEDGAESVAWMAAVELQGPASFAQKCMEEYTDLDIVSNFYALDSTQPEHTNEDVTALKFRPGTPVAPDTKINTTETPTGPTDTAPPK